MFIGGIVICLTGAAIMFHGSIFAEEYNSGIATVIGITGIGLIATSGYKLSTSLYNRKKGKKD